MALPSVTSPLDSAAVHVPAHTPVRTQPLSHSPKYPYPVPYPSVSVVAKLQDPRDVIWAVEALRHRLQARLSASCPRQQMWDLHPVRAHVYLGDRRRRDLGTGRHRVRVLRKRVRVHPPRFQCARDLGRMVSGTDPFVLRQLTLEVLGIWMESLAKQRALGPLTLRMCICLVRLSLWRRVIQLEACQRDSACEMLCHTSS
jgi:hypothetical protein